MIKKLQSMLGSKIRNKIILGTMCAMIPMIIIILVTHYAHRTTTVESSKLILKMKTNEVSVRISAYLQEQYRIFHDWTKIDLFGLAIEFSTVADLQAHFDTFLGDKEGFSYLALLDANGHILVRANRDEQQEEQEDRDIILQDLSSIKGDYDIRIIACDSDGDEESNEEFYIVHIFRTYNSAKRCNGFVVAALDMQNIAQKMRDYFWEGDTRRFDPQTLCLNLFDMSTSRVLCRNNGLLLRQVLLPSATEKGFGEYSLQQLLGGAYVKAEKKNIYYAIFSPILAIPVDGLIDETNYTRRSFRLYISAMVPEASITAESQRILMISGIIMLVGLLVMIMLAIYVSISITHPIAALAEVLNRVRRGQTAERAYVESHDEIGFFAQEFNRLLDTLEESNKQLKDYSRNLEDIVEQRTVELARTNEELSSMNTTLKDEIQNRIHAEANLTKVNERLVESKLMAQKATQQWEVTFNAIQDLISIHDTEFNIVQCNKAFEQVFGLAGKDWLGHKCCRIVHDRIAPLPECPSISAQKNHEAKTIELFETKLNKYLEISVYPIVSATEGVKGVVHIAKDITGRKILERELTQAQKLESIGTLAAGIAHEINTPVQFIANNTQFMVKGIEQILQLIDDYQALLERCARVSNNEEILQEMGRLADAMKLSFLKEEIPLALSQSQEGVERVATIIGAMKDFSHMGSATMAHEDINQAVESTITISRNEWKYVAELQAELDRNLPLVECFVGDIKQVVLNLIVNAAHAIGDAIKQNGSEQGLITVRTYSKENSVYITVGDTGTGIPENVRARVFDYFFTTKEIGKGTGQGLSMAYQTIAEKHCGNLTFETEEGVGTTFIIQLPVNQPDKTA